MGSSRDRSRSSEELVLAHLAAHATHPDGPHAVPHSLCQEGVALALGMTRANAGVILRRLEREGKVLSQRRTVAGIAGRKRLAFFPLKASASGVSEAARDGTPGEAALTGSPLFVGRSQELSQLRAWFRSPDPGVLTVVGPAGIGKSALAARALADAPGDTPTFVHAFNNLSTLRNFLLSLADFLAPLGRRELRHFLGSRPAAPIDAAKVALQHALANLRGVIVLDDIHKMLPEVEAVLPALTQAARTGGPKLLLVGRGLPTFLTDGPPDALETITLGALGASESADLLARRGFAPNEIDEVVEKAAGFPFVLRLAQPGRRRRAWRDVAAYLGELNRDLHADERLALQRAAIHRKAIPADALLAVDAGEATLLRLERWGLLIRRGEAWTLHDLLRDFYLGTLPPGLASKLHDEAAARVHVRAQGARDVDLIEEMFHLRQAGRDEEAIAVAIKHGMDLVTKGHNTELYDVLQLLRSSHISRRQLGWKCVLEARMLTYLGRPSEALAAARQGLAIGEEIADGELMALSAREGGHVFWFTRQHAEGVMFVGLWLRRLALLKAESFVADLRNMHGILTHESGDPEGARKIFEENVAYVSQHDADQLLLVKTYANLGKSLRLVGRARDALPPLRQALASSLSAGFHVFASTQRLNLAWAYMDLNDHEEAARNLEHVLAAVNSGPVEEVPEVLWAHGKLLLETGRHSDAVEPLRQAANMYRTRNDMQTASQIQGLLEAATRGAHGTPA